MKSTTKIVGSKSQAELYFDAIKSEQRRANEIRAAGGFTIREMARAAGISDRVAEARCKRDRLAFEVVSAETANGQSRPTKFFMPPGVKLPPRA